MASSPSSSFCDDSSRRPSSDFDSEASQRTVSEKHDSERDEKPHRLHSDPSNGDVVMTQSDVVTSYRDPQNIPTSMVQSLQLDTCTDGQNGKATSVKRAADTSPSEIANSDDRLPALPRKKKATQQVLEGESVHGPEQKGYSIKDFMEFTRIKRRLGLVRQYEEIKRLPPKGTFFSSRSVDLIHSSHKPVQKKSFMLVFLIKHSIMPNLC